MYSGAFHPRMDFTMLSIKIYSAGGQIIREPQIQRIQLAPQESFVDGTYLVFVENGRMTLSEEYLDTNLPGWRTMLLEEA